MLRMCVYMHSRFVENHPIRILEDGPLISEVVLSQQPLTLKYALVRPSKTKRNHGTYSIRIPPWNLNKPRRNNHLCVTWMPWPPQACNERARSWQGPVCYSPLVRMLDRRGCSLSRWINRTSYGNHRIRQFWMVKLTCHPKLALTSSYIIGTFLFILH
jgi:hypothetical protein